MSITRNEKDAFWAIVEQMEKWSGCPFSHFKKNTLFRRINRRLILTRQPTFKDYLHFLTTHPEEYQELFDSITIKVSTFFRDPGVFKTIKQGVLPELFRRAQLQSQPVLRVWCAACATGEEAYSIGILIHEHQSDNPRLSNIQPSVLGSDLDPMAIEEAERGVYGLESVSHGLGLYPQYFHRIVNAGEELYAIDPLVREIVSFVTFDCTNPEFQSPPGGVFAEYDMIFLRNVLIYYDDDIKERMLRKAFHCLKPKGFLVLGKAEVPTGGLASRFQVFSREHKIFIRSMDP